MKTLGRRLALATALAGGIAASQGPEFAQQYRQRLGGAIDELRTVVARFDDDASASGMDRDTALERHDVSPDTFFRDRGRSTRETIARYETLSRQAERLADQPDYLDPLVLVTAADPSVLTGAWRDYQPAVPLTPSSLTWAGAGFVLGGLLIALLARLGSGASGMVRRRWKTPAADTA
jgi:hypothetical protein